MSTLEIKIVSLTIKPHPSADFLELAEIKNTGFVCIVKKNQFVDGDLCIFVPADTIIPTNIREYLINTSKIKTDNGRIRCVKIKGVFSDGLCLIPKDWLPESMIVDGNDVGVFLQIQKYEPLPPRQQNNIKSKGINHNYHNDNFKKYTDIENFKKHPKTLQDGEEVVATIKYHGSNWRATICKRPKSSFNWWERLKISIGFRVEQNEYLVGSHNTIRKCSKKATEVKDVFWEVANKYNIKTTLENIKVDFPTLDVAIYGEVVGPGLQNGYEYGISEGEHELRIFDVMIGGIYMDWDTVTKYCKQFNLPIVDVVYRGPWNADIVKLAEAIDEYNGKKYIREGIVIKPVVERKDTHNGRVILKYVSDEFRLNKDNTEWH